MLGIALSAAWACSAPSPIWVAAWAFSWSMMPLSCPTQTNPRVLSSGGGETQLAMAGF